MNINCSSTILKEALSLSHSIRLAGAKCGICIAPSTPVDIISDLLVTKYTDGSPLIDLVDILAVNPVRYH